MLLLFPVTFATAFIVKTRKEAKRMTTMDSLSATRARIEELKRIVEDQKARKNEYAAIISQQSEGSFGFLFFELVVLLLESFIKTSYSVTFYLMGFMLHYKRLVSFIFPVGHPLKGEQQYE